MNLGSAIRCPPGSRILVRSVNWLGDAVMSTPALLRLREACPDAFIALLTPLKLADLWQNHPAADAVLTFAQEETAFAVARRLRSEGFQVALVLPNSFRSALEARLARVPNRIGYSGQWRDWLLTQPIAPPIGSVDMRKRSRREIERLTKPSSAIGARSLTPDRVLASRSAFHTPANLVTAAPRVMGPGSAHHIHQYLNLVGQLGADPTPLAPQLFVKDSEMQLFLDRFQIDADPARPLFGLNPGAEYGPAKRWPAERFIAVAIEVQRRTRCRWLILGGKGDVALAQRVAAGIDGASPQTDSAASRQPCRRDFASGPLCRSQRLPCPSDQ
jgi:heptosyltransferase II